MSNTNIFKTTSLNVGDSATIVVTDVKDGKYGPMFVGTVNGQSSIISPSGNLKFKLPELELNKAVTITRIADTTSKTGYKVTQFSLADGEKAVAASSSSVADKLAAIRAKRPANGTNTSNS